MSGGAAAGAPSRPVVGAAWLVYLFLLIPSLIVIPISFGNPGQIEFPPRVFTLDLYRQFFRDPSWWGSLVQSAIVAVATTILSVVLSVPAAYALARSLLPGRGALRAFFLMPMLVPVVVLGLGLYLQYSAWGLLDTTVGTILAHVTITVPFVMVSVLSGLNHADRQLESVALIMGASRATIFRRVVLPQLRNSIAVGAMFAFLMSLDEVVVAYFITGTGTTTLPVKMYSSIRWELTPVIAAVSTLLTVVSLVVALGIILLQRWEEAAR